MGFSTHPLVVIPEQDNYESWAKSILTHCMWINIFPHLYDLIPEPNILGRKIAWDIIRDHLVGLICSTVNFDTMCVVSDTICPYTLWNHLWEIHGDPNLSPYPKDPASDCLLPMATTNFIPIYDATLEDLEYLAGLAHFDGSKACILVPTL